MLHHLADLVPVYKCPAQWQGRNGALGCVHACGRVVGWRLPGCGVSLVNEVAEGNWFV